ACHINMASASHLFHYELYIYFINRPCADEYFILVVCQDKSSFHTVNIQQFIGSLGSNYSRTVHPICRAYRYGETAFIGFHMAYRLCLCPVVLEIVPEHLPHSGHISAASSQKCLFFKSSDSCRGSKVIGINDNS